MQLWLDKLQNWLLDNSLIISTQKTNHYQTTLDEITDSKKSGRQPHSDTLDDTEACIVSPRRTAEIVCAVINKMFPPPTDLNSGVAAKLLQLQNRSTRLVVPIFQFLIKKLDSIQF
ncbi:unnamed protein product [Allacma fusca]|uniref:Uncharacterized protein n=1 Tax=Allacma fusca TaxID=39272 RepID=A0A8J2L5P3_9HEXA|nr:unnamed protein product [Allacma fusca]